MENLITGDTLPIVITFVFGFIFGLFDKPDGTSYLNQNAKTLIVVVLGALGGIGYLYYVGAPPVTMQSLIDFAIMGAKTCLTSIGLYKVGQAARVFSRKEGGVRAYRKKGILRMAVSGKK